VVLSDTRAQSADSSKLKAKADAPIASSACSGQYQLVHLEPQARLNSDVPSMPKNSCKGQKRWPFPQMHRHQCKATRIIKNQGIITSPKETIRL
jgi:hypothetical protein